MWWSTRSLNKEVDEVVNEDKAKAVAMKFVKELGQGLKLEDVVRSYRWTWNLMVVMEMELDKEFDVEVKWEVNKEVAKDVLMFIMC